MIRLQHFFKENQTIKIRIKNFCFRESFLMLLGLCFFKNWNMQFQRYNQGLIPFCYSCFIDGIEFFLKVLNTEIQQVQSS